MESRLLHGDCLEVLRTLEAESVDAAVTDPPYELGFMNKHWDSTGIAFQPETWREVMRVLKPGAHLLAFGGTRTFHRIAVAIEDAGFEIRDSLAWLHGQGFPKSLDIGKMFDKHGGVTVAWFGPWLRQERERRGINQKELAKHFPSRSGGLTGCVANWELGLNLPTPEQFNTICDVLGLSFERIEEAEREVIGHSENWGAASASTPNAPNGQWDLTVPATSLAKKWHGWGTALKPAFEPVIMARKPFKGSVKGNVEKHGTGALNIDQCRIATDDALGGGAEKGETVCATNHEGWDRPWKHDDVARAAHAERVRSNVAKAEARGRWPANCVLSHHPDCGVLPTWEREPSPCDSNAADAVSGQKHATSATRGSIVQNSVALTPNERAKPRQPAIGRTDIGCSDGLFPVEPSESRTADSSLNTSAFGNRPTVPSLTDSSSITETATDSITDWKTCNSLPDENTAPSTRRSAPTANASVGRWHCVPECPVRVLDEQSGETSTPDTVTRGAGGQHGKYSPIGRQDDVACYGDTGGASRFFYCAKPSREERDMGCWDLRERSGGEATARTDGTAGLQNPRAGAGRTGGARNFHPTVKPIELMRWLVRLVTPVNGTVIDPFLGSGTTGIACRYELRNFIGIEREAEYLEIARRRIAAAVPLFSESA